MWCKTVCATGLGSLSHPCPWPCKALWNSWAQRTYPITIPEQWWFSLVLTGAHLTQHFPAPPGSIPTCSTKACSHMSIHLVNDWIELMTAKRGLCFQWQTSCCLAPHLDCILYKIALLKDTTHCPCETTLTESVGQTSGHTSVGLGQRLVPAIHRAESRCNMSSVTFDVRSQQ